MNQEQVGYTGFDYKKVTLQSDTDMQYMDGIITFGWCIDEAKTTTSDEGTMHYVLKRNRSIINKMELVRLEKNYDFCFHEILRLRKSIHTRATMYAITIGLIGTAFIAGSTFAVTHEPPVIWLCVVLAIPGFIGWILPYFVYQKAKRYQSGLVERFIKEKYDEIEHICAKASQLL